MNELPAKQRVKGNVKWDALGKQLRACYEKHSAVIVDNDIVKAI